MSWKKELLKGASLVFLKQDFKTHNIVNTYTLDHVMSFFNINYSLTSATITITCFVPTVNIKKIQVSFKFKNSSQKCPHSRNLNIQEQTPTQRNPKSFFFILMHLNIIPQHISQHSIWHPHPHPQTHTPPPP